MRDLLRWLLVAAAVLTADTAVADRDIDGVPIPDARSEAFGSQRPIRSRAHGSGAGVASSSTS